MLAAIGLVDSWPAEWLSDPNARDAGGHPGQRLEGHPVLHGDLPRRAQGHRQRPLRGGDGRRRLAVAALRARHAARAAPRHDRDGAAVVDLDVQQLRPDLADDPGRARGRHRAVRDGGLLEGHPAAAARRGRRGHAGDAADHRHPRGDPGADDATQRPARRRRPRAQAADSRRSAGAAVGDRRGLDARCWSGRRRTSCGRPRSCWACSCCSRPPSGGSSPRSPRGATSWPHAWSAASAPGSRWWGCWASCSPRCTG